MTPLYLDAASTSGHRPPEVIEAVVHAMEAASANPGRSAHRVSLAAARLVEDARDQIGVLVGAPDPASVAFTHNATQALNTALLGVLEPGDRVAVDPWAHNALMRPLRYLESSRGVVVVDLPATPGEPLDLEAVARVVGSVRMVALTLASNVTGQVLPVAQVGRLCRAAGALLLVDAAQGGGVAHLDVERDCIDLLALTGHKSLYGPTGTGALWARDPLSVQPLVRGGTGSRSQHELHPSFPPDRLEAGTLNVAGLAGLAAGIRWVRARGLDALWAHHQSLRERLCRGLRALEGVEVHRGDGHGVATVSFTATGHTTSSLGRALDAHLVYTRTGLQCAPRAHGTLGTLQGGTVRLSASALTSPAVVDEALERLAAVL